MKKTLEKLARIPNKYEEVAQDHPYMATVAETVALYGLRRGLEALGKRRGINLGNALLEDHIDTAAKKPLKAAGFFTLAGPLTEEAQYRMIPGMAIDWVQERHGTQAARVMKVASALGFAATHAGILRKQHGSAVPRFNTDTSKMSVPVSQFIGGSFYEGLRKRRGYKHGIAVHVTTNTLKAIEVAPQVYKRRRELKRNSG